MWRSCALYVASSIRIVQLCGTNSSYGQYRICQYRSSFEIRRQCFRFCPRYADVHKASLLRNCLRSRSNGREDTFKRNRKPLPESLIEQSSSIVTSSTSKMSSAMLSSSRHCPSTISGVIVFFVSFEQGDKERKRVAEAITNMIRRDLPCIL